MKKKKFWSLIGVPMALIPLSLAANCSLTTSQEDKNKNPDDGNKNPGDGNQNPGEKQDAVSIEIQKLSYTALSDADFKNVVIADSTILNESVAEQLGFMLPDTIEKLIVKQKGAEAPEYTIKVSKAKDSLDVTYKYQKTGEEEEKTKTVTVSAYASDDLSSVLEELKQYNATANSADDWKNKYASGFYIPASGQGQINSLQIKKLANYAATIQEQNSDLRIYVRKAKTEDTVKYVVVKTLEQGQRIVAIGDPVTVSPTPDVLIALRNKLKVFDASGANHLTASVSSKELRDLEYAKTAIVPEDANNKFDWTAIKTTAPDASKLPAEAELQDQAATDKGKIEVEKVKGETTLHWYITYIDASNKPLTDEYISNIITAAPTKADVVNYDWTQATKLNHGDAPSSLIFATKPVVSKITSGGQTYYIYTDKNAGVGVVQSKRYSGINLDDTSKHIWVASNAKDTYFNEVRMLQSESTGPSYDDFKDAAEVYYMEAQ